MASRRLTAGAATATKLLRRNPSLSSHLFSSSSYLHTKILHHLNPNPSPPFNPINKHHALIPKWSSHVNTRLFSTASPSENDEKPRESGQQGSFKLRPLSPHLTIYQPQSNSTSSISNRMTGAFLVGAVLSFHLLCVKMGPICFTYPEFYKLFFYSSKETLLFAEIAALALAYHTYKGVLHLLTDFSGSAALTKVSK